MRTNQMSLQGVGWDPCSMWIRVSKGPDVVFRVYFSTTIMSLVLSYHGRDNNSDGANFSRLGGGANFPTLDFPNNILVV